jgi:hypothetical protein
MRNAVSKDRPGLFGNLQTPVFGYVALQLQPRLLHRVLRSFNFTPQPLILDSGCSSPGCFQFLLCGPVERHRLEVDGHKSQVFRANQCSFGGFTGSHGDSVGRSIQLASYIVGIPGQIDVPRFEPAQFGTRDAELKRLRTSHCFERRFPEAAASANTRR